MIVSHAIINHQHETALRTQIMQCVFMSTVISFQMLIYYVEIISVSFCVQLLGGGGESRRVFQRRGAAALQLEISRRSQQNHRKRLKGTTLPT